MRFLGLALLGLVAMSGLGGCSEPERYHPPRVVEPYPDERPALRGDWMLRRIMLDVHNSARERAGVPPLIWNEELAADAARYAAVLAVTGDFKHSVSPRGRTAEGENLFVGSHGDYRYDEMAQLWVDEDRNYRPGVFPDVSETGRWHDVGHYTQIIWRGTTEIGCAIASNDSDDYLVCRYSPPGNVWGRHVDD